MSIQNFLLTFLLASLFTSCTPDKSTQDKKVDKDQTFLINGYSHMYKTLGAFEWTEELLLVKLNSKELKGLGERLDEASTKIRERLDRMKNTEAWLELENTGASDMQTELFASMTRERIKSYTPVLGLSEEIFERTFLLVASGILNQMKHLTYVMLEVEKDKKRIEFLEMAKESFEKLREEVLKLLNSKYFKHDKFSKK